MSDERIREIGAACLKVIEVQAMTEKHSKDILDAARQMKDTALRLKDNGTNAEYAEYLKTMLKTLAIFVSVFAFSHSSVLIRTRRPLLSMLSSAANSSSIC